MTRLHEIAKSILERRETPAVLPFRDSPLPHEAMNQITQTVALVAAFAASAGAMAQDDIHPSLNSKYWVEVGGYYPTHSVSLGVEGSNDIIDSQIDFEAAVDLSDRKGLWIAEIGWQFGENWAVNAQYFETDRSRNFVLQEQIEWDDLIFDVGVDITAGTDASVTRLYFSRKMLEEGPHDLRLGVGIHRLSIGGFIEGSATLDDQSTEFRAESVTAQAPLPNLGAWYRYSPSDRWVFTLRADWFSASIGDISGTLIDLLVGANFRLTNNIGVGVNYQRLSVNGRVEKEGWRGDLDIVYEGPQLIISGYW